MMRRRLVPAWCDRCNDAGSECPDCGGDVPTLATRARWRLARARAGQVVLGGRRGAVEARRRWVERDAPEVSAWTSAPRTALNDAQRRRLIEDELRGRLEAAVPLGWRRDDVVWALRNARRAVVGLEPVPYGWERVASVRLRQDHADFFIRDRVLVLAELRRRVVRFGG